MIVPIVTTLIGLCRKCAVATAITLPIGIIGLIFIAIKIAIELPVAAVRDRCFEQDDINKTLITAC